MTSSAPATDFTSTAERATDDLSVVYLVYREMLSSIIPSQVITPLAKLSESLNVELVGHISLGHIIRRRWRKKFNAVKQIAKSNGLKTTWLAAPPPRTPWLWSDRSRLRRWLRRRFRRDERFILHCRGIVMTRLAIQAASDFPNARIICDARGDEVAEHLAQMGFTDNDESLLNTKQREHIDAVRECEQFAISRSHGVTAVSNSLLQTLSQRNAVSLVDRSLVIPCCPDIDAFDPSPERRETARRELGLSNKFVVCYLGSMAWYQMPELSLRVFRLIQQLRSDAHFLAITTQPDQMEKAVLAQGITRSDYTIRSVPPTEVPHWLIAADLGLMLRKQDAVNRAASPVKFGEYLTAGVPVVISQGVGDASYLVKLNQLGLVVDVEGDESQLLAGLQECLMDRCQEHLRRRCRETATRSMNWPALNASRMEFYASRFEPVKAA